MAPSEERPADAVAVSWVDKAPAAARPYLRLARFDRPIGTWLLLWPCWWSLALAALAQGDGAPNLLFMALFAVGAAVMRGAGCAYNDIVDVEFDAAVERTRARPLPSGQVKRWHAMAWAGLLSLVGLSVLLQFNGFTIALGMGSLAIVAIYPFAKRFTYWPQAVLGLAFNWGALMGWTAVCNSLGAAPVFLYIAGIAWTLGYDTIYAHQDKEDDALIGVKSTALKFGPATAAWLNRFYAATALFLTLAVIAAGGGWIGALLVIGVCAHLGWQVSGLDINDSGRCLMLFRSNRDFGALVFAAIVLTSLVK